MRLRPEERETIRKTVHEVYGPTATVRLFGSRVHDHLRGGDIDLHVEADPVGEERFPSRRTRLWAALQQRLGEQRIDIVANDRDRPDRAIDRTAKRDGTDAVRPDRSGETIEDAHKITVRVMRSLRASLDKLETRMPIDAGWLAAADRRLPQAFANLVEAGRRLHRAAIVQAAEGEPTMTAQEINRRLETLNLLLSADRWYQVIGARNATTHEYAADFDVTAEAITEAFDAAKIALEMVPFTLTEVRRRFPESSPELQWP